jgi:hypothetical protein
MFISLLTNVVKCDNISLLRNNYFSYRNQTKDTLMTALLGKTEKQEQRQKRRAVHKHIAAMIDEVRRKGNFIQWTGSRASRGG